MNRWTGRLRRIRARDQLVVVGIAVLLVEAGALVWISESPPVSASVSWVPSGTGVQAQLTVRTGLSGADVRVSLLPGEATHRSRGHAVMAFVDPSFPFDYGPFSDAMSDSAWIWLYLSDLGSPASPEMGVPDASALPTELARYPNSTLVMLDAGSIPDSLLSTNSSVLKNWLDAGGTLVWAGGPIGYEEGHTSSSGRYVSDDLGWEGQADLVGFNLTDPSLNGSEPAPSSAGSFSALGTALGLSYSFAGFGANLTELTRHGGVSLGFETVAGPPGQPSPRTSIAYVPVGHGTLLYFGGGTGAPGDSEIPEASEELSQDIAVLLDLGYVPGSTAPATTFDSLGPLTSTTSSLVLSDRSDGAVAFVRTGIPGSVLYAWSQEINPPTASMDDSRNQRPTPRSSLAESNSPPYGRLGGSGGGPRE